MISSTSDITIAPRSYLGLSCDFQSTYFPAESFKNSIKRDARIFTTLKDGKYWDTWHRDTIAIARTQDVVEVLNPDYHDVTTDNVNLIK